MRISASALLGMLSLAACGTQAERKPPDPLADDPAIVAALADEIMIDPDLVGQDQGIGAIVLSGPLDAGVPPERVGPEAAAIDRAEAGKLAGGTIRTAPEPGGGNGSAALLRRAMTLGQIAAAAGQESCAGRIEYSARWAARLPQGLEVYPHGAVQEAAGNDRNDCRLRVVHFVTPVEPRDVIDYYFTRASAAGYGARHTLDGGAHVLAGSRGGSGYLIHARAGEGGLTEVDLLVSGG